MIDRDPIEPRPQVGLHLTDKIACVFPQIGQLGRILRRHYDPEMVPVILTPIGKPAIVGAISIRIEHARCRAVTGDALALQITDMRG